MRADPRPYLKRLPRDRYRLASSSGAGWTVHDYRLVNGRRRVLQLGSKVAQYRAFAPADGPVLVPRFREGNTQKTDPFDLERQFRAAEVLGTMNIMAPGPR